MNIKILSDGGKTMVIKKLEISGIGGIEKLQLEFESGWNVICGANGVGKTIILNIIADTFSLSNRIIKKNAKYEVGEYAISYMNNKHEIVNEKRQIKSFRPEETESMNFQHQGSEYFMYFNANRDIKYQKLSSIPITGTKSVYDSACNATEGIGISDMKGWFVQRCLFSKQEIGISEALLADLNLAKRAFGLLDDTISFYSIDPISSDIILDTYRGQIAFEYLSSGYKMCIYIVIGMIKEIESRFAGNLFKAEEFDGVVLIDEVDLHLHPAWQAKLIKVLKQIFPRTQFICTTHSPSILQSLQAHEIIPLGSDECGNTVIKELNMGAYGLQGWTLEEILTDVMDMPSTTSELFQKTINAFDKAMNDENTTGIKEYYGILDKMLHPDSTLRKLLQIQMAGMEE